MAKIILIEDSKNLALALKPALELKGHEVLWVNDGRRALMEIKKFMPNIILLDLMLPHVSGFEICQAVKSDMALMKIPVIIMSTLTGQEDMERAQNAGADYFISKPYNLQQTLSEIFKFIPKTEK
ncbi:MAG: response regulator [Elusimicrobiaceae bacterium]|nr:response regulator [Elusimicrobiaceae bacterium]